MNLTLLAQGPWPTIVAYTLMVIWSNFVRRAQLKSLAEKRIIETASDGAWHYLTFVVYLVVVSAIIRVIGLPVLDYVTSAILWPLWRLWMLL